MTENKRTQQRYDRRLAIEFAVDDQWRSSFTRNMSLGGVYIETDLKLPLGRRVKLKFQLPTQKEAVEVGAQVRWADSSGVGVQFDGLRARDVWALGKFFEQSE